MLQLWIVILCALKSIDLSIKCKKKILILLFEGMFIFQLTGDSVQTPPNKYRCPNENKTKQNRTEQIHKTKHQLDFLTSIWFTEVNECGILRSFAQNPLSYPIQSTCTLFQFLLLQKRCKHSRKVEKIANLY